MIPSLRFIRLLALGAPFWTLGALVPGGWLAGAGCCFAAMLLFAWDMFQARGAPPLTVERILPARFGLGETQTIELRCHNHGDAPVRIHIRDEAPAALAPIGELAPLAMPPKSSATCSYSVCPLQRGAFQFGNIIARVQQGLGLVLKEQTIPGNQTVKVYPRFRGVDDYALLAKIDQRDEVVRRPRRLRGSGTDFESLRPYVPGEDLRVIDWKATARRAALISRNQQVEKGQQIAVLLDAGRLMGEVVEGYSKLDHAMNAAILLGFVAQKRGDTLASVCFSNRIESFLPPTRGVPVLSRLLETLYAVQSRAVESDYWLVTAEAMGMLRRRSLVIMLTDLLDAVSSLGLINNLKRAARQHLVLCVVFDDPPLRATAVATPAGLPETYRVAAACDLLRRRRLALEQMRKSGILVLETEPARLGIQLVRRYLEIRRADLQ